MDTVQLGEIEDGIPVFIDRITYERADVTIPISRVKPHTDFHGPVESGLMKMIAIGLGKQKGADTFHRQGFGEFSRLIPAVAQYTLSRVNMPFGLALVENGYGQLRSIEAVPAKQIWEREQVLLRIARESMARLPQIPAIDVLIVDRIGKDISGDGADPNVINRDCAGVVNLAELGVKPAIQRLIVRDLTDDTGGNATGIGMFDFALRRAVARIDPIATYMNMLTAKVPAGARIPITIDKDREALYLAVTSCLKVDQSIAKIARIANTKDLDTFWASEALLPDLLATGNVEPLGDMAPIAFDAAGMFVERTVR
jgi:hypothetical protein